MPEPETPIDFEALVRAHHATVYRCAFRVLRSEADARDAAQEVFVDVLEHPARFAEARDAGAVLAWSATKKALARLRGDRNRRRREDEHAMRERNEPGGDPAERNEREEARGAVRRMVEALPDELRVALGLRFEEELSFAAIARATGCSEPTAHDRVRRALDQLRGGMRRAGFAGALPLLPSWLARGDAPVPGGLETQLLSLSKVGVAAAPWWAAGGVLIATLGTAVALLVVNAQDAPRDELAALTPDGAAGAAGAASRVADGANVDPIAAGGGGERFVVAGAAATAPSRDHEAGEDPAPGIPERALRGRVVDDTGRPVADVWVRASSREYQGKLPLFHASTFTDAGGAFALSLPVSHADGQDYRVETTHEAYVSTRRDHVHVARDADPAPLELSVIPNTEDLAGDWRLVVHVADQDALPVAGAELRVMCRVRHDAASWSWVVEDGGYTDANGRAELSGARLGEKRVVVLPAKQGMQSREVRYGVDRAGEHALEIDVLPGLAIEGTVTTVDGSPLPEDLRVIVTGEDTNRWLFADVGHGGAFRYEGLDPGACTVRVYEHGWSPVFLRDVEAGGPPIHVALKRADDPRDVGTHLAEFHGSLRDAETGEPVLADLWDVDTIALWDDREGALTLDELFASHRTPRPVQRMLDAAPPPPSADFHEVGLGPGRYLLAARVEGYAPRLAGPFEVTGDEVRAGIELALERGGVLEGRVVDAAGRPVTDAWLYLAPVGEWGRARLLELDHLLRDEGPRSLYECERAGKDGRFRVDRIPTAQPYLLCALGRDHAPTVIGRVEWTRSGEVVRRDVTLPARAD